MEQNSHSKAWPDTFQMLRRLLYDGPGQTLVIRPGKSADPERVYAGVCVLFENTKIEQDSEGNVYVISPAGGESSHQNQQLTLRLGLWAQADGRGKAFDSSVGFIFPDGSKRSPDGSWVKLETLKALTRDQLRKLLQVVPDFVVEIMSPSDDWSDLQAKMREYSRNSVALGWLIDPDKRRVEIHRRFRLPETLDNPTMLRGEDPVGGFTLDLEPIWEGLNF